MLAPDDTVEMLPGKYQGSMSHDIGSNYSSAQ